LGGPGFKSWPGDQLSWLQFFMVFLSPSMIMLGYYLKLGHNCFHPHTFQFVVHISPFHFTLHSPSDWKCIIK
jgi:hypothetical protein